MVQKPKSSNNCGTYPIYYRWRAEKRINGVRERKGGEEEGERKGEKGSSRERARGGEAHAARKGARHASPPPAQRSARASHVT
jgi:hypothetical protein